MRTQPSLNLSHFTNTYIAVNKRKEKEIYYIFVLQRWHTHTHTHTHTHIYIYVHIYISSSYRAASTDIPDPLAPLSFISSGISSGLHPVSSHSCCMHVRAGRLTFARPYEEVHWSASLMSSSLLLQQSPACLVRLTWIVFVMGGRWPYSWCLVGCCRQDLFYIPRNILV